MSSYSDLIKRLAERVIAKPSAVLAVPAEGRRSLFLEVLTLRPGIRLFLLILGASFALCGLVVPITQKMALDTIITSKSDVDYGAAALLFIGSFTALIVARGIELLVRMIGMRESIVAEKWLSIALYQKTLTLRSELRHQHTVGETVGLIASHISMLGFFLTDLFPSFFTAFIPVIIAPFILGFYFNLSPLPVFGVVFVALGFCLIFAYNSSRLFQNFKTLDGVRLGSVNEWIRNLRALRVLGWVDAFESKVMQRSQTAVRAHVKVAFFSQIMNSFFEAVPMLLSITGILTLIYTRAQPPTPGEIFGILWVLTVFLAIPMRTLPWVFVIARDAAASLQRIEGYLRQPSDEDGPAPSSERISQLTTAPHHIALEVRNLSLILSGHQVLQKLSFAVKEGELLAIVGDVGSGKTQLLKALLREVPADYSSYEIFGFKADDLSRAETRAFFAIAPQDSFTIGASLHENVHFNFNPHPPAPVRREISRSLDLASFTSDLQIFERGLETQLGERGINLSGGQKQRLGLARVHFSNRRIMLLDDSLSALDADTEKEVFSRLFLHEWSGKTRLLVTHRLSVLPKVDRILFLQQGQIKAHGHWHELQHLAEFQDFVSSLKGDKSES